MNEFIAGLLYVAVSDTYIRALKAHEECYFGGQCLWRSTALQCELTMCLCQGAQRDLEQIIRD